MLASRAFQILLLLCGVSLLSVHCKPSRHNNNSEQMAYLFPHETYQGTSPSVELLLQDVDIQNCDQIMRHIGGLPEEFESSVQFVPVSTDGSLEYPIRVRRMELVDSNRLRFQLSVPETAILGAYTVRVSCRSDDVYLGYFKVREWRDVPELVFEPSELPAGSEYQRIRVSLNDPSGRHFFEDGRTRLVVGPDADVTVFDVVVDSDARTLSAWISVSGLALEPGADTRQVDVMAVTGTLIARGVFVITSPEYPKISITPNSVIRPTFGDDITSVPIRLVAHNLLFSEHHTAPEEEGGESSFFPVIRVPDIPGLSIDGVQVLSADTLQFILQISSAAFLGPVPLLVEFGESAVYSTLTILPSAEGSAVHLHPRVTDVCRSEDCAPRLVIAKGVGVAFSADTSVSVSPSTILLEKVTILSADTIALHLRTLPWDEPIPGVILFSTQGENASAGILFDVASTHHFERLSGHIQGERKNVLLKLEDTQLRSGPMMTVPASGGTFFDAQVPFGSSIPDGMMDGIVLLDYSAVPDAPTGPTRMDLNPTNSVAPVWLELEPSGDVPSLTIVPDIVFLPDRVTRHTLHGGGGLLLDSSALLNAADPAIRIESVQDLGADTVEITLHHLPGASAGQGILYAETLHGRAAASYRSVSRDVPVVAASFNQTLFRSRERGEISISIPPGFKNRHIAASIPDGIGVQMERIYPTYWGQRLKVEFSMDKTGPGGWFGLVLSESGREAVVPLEIVSVTETGERDQTLNADLIPSTLPPGVSEELVLIQVPDALMLAQPPVRFRRTSSRLVFATEGIAGRLSDIPPGAQLSVQAYVDLPYDVHTPDEYPGIPVIVTTDRGAVIGFVEVQSSSGPVLRSMSIDGSFHYLHSTYENVLLQASFSTPLFDEEHLVDFRMENISGGYTPDVSILSSDRRIPVSRISGKGGFAWGKTPVSLLLSSEESFSLTARNIGKRGGAYPGEFRCDRPMYHLGDITAAGQTMAYSLSVAGQCRAVAVVSARSLTNSPWATPNLQISQCDSMGVCTETTTKGPDGSPDPRLYLDVTHEPSRLEVNALMGTIGYFLLNIRGPAVIRGVSRHPDHSRVELDMEPGTSLASCELVRRDPDLGQDILSLSLTGIVPDSGIVRVSTSTEAWVSVTDSVGVSVFDPLSDFLLELRCDDEYMDSIQVGGAFDPDGLEEGLALENRENDCFTRIGNSVDTNRNRSDFILGWNCIPGS
jgi:hypothetical protein